ncbi:hypothetical protein GCM10010384_55700 [Streptomyces djakartensis]|uniref:Uncharacterized protein n=1 Tax=Streptomyces djakartensis TaxID=68193 RepID=A0ABQ3ABQ9_9ACTN|nr:hypothetical protein GCM10010384_55700 [Streptomyces djakartensis]
MDSPVAAADPVICRTSRFCTVSCIHVPAFDTKFAADHQRMLRYLSDRQGEREVGWAGEGKEEDTVRYSSSSPRTQEREDEGNGKHRLRCAVAPLAGTGADHRGRGTPRVGAARGSPAACALLKRARKQRIWRSQCG